mmetsp:Transcript_18338/g.32956  ORF Transcript_18338/g.32956 Transcript_18338/m.32956 type:complete len:129 (+) Transcript_18338:2645-3031(+)
MDNSVSRFVEKVTSSFDEAVTNTLEVQANCQEADEAMTGTIMLAAEAQEALTSMPSLEGAIEQVKACTATTKQSVSTLKSLIDNSTLEATETISKIEAEAVQWRIRAKEAREKMRKEYSERLKHICYT